MNEAKLFLLAAIAGCGGGGSGADAAPDIDNGTCGATIRFTGEYVDWDNDTTFCGLFSAVFTVQGNGMQSTLPPNGRVDLCVPDQATTLIDIAPPTQTPSCKTAADHYRLPGIAVADKAVILAGGSWSGRSFTEARQSFDTTKAQVYVHVVGPARAVSLDAQHAHGPAQAVADKTWAAGDTGHEVYLPDVDPTGGSATLSVAGGAIGAGAIPLVAGKMTTLTVVTH
jgi:hypothetical protein